MIVYKGQCEGGPKDGEKISVKTPKGFILVDQQNSCMWIYDFSVVEEVVKDTLWSGWFYIRSNTPSELDEVKLDITRKSSNWSILAHG